MTSENRGRTLAPSFRKALRCLLHLTTWRRGPIFEGNGRSVSSREFQATHRGAGEDCRKGDGAGKEGVFQFARVFVFVVVAR
jgi:hypothetical protein